MGTAGLVERRCVVVEVLTFDRSWPTPYARQSRPGCYQTVIRLLSDCYQTVIRLLSDCYQTAIRMLVCLGDRSSLAPSPRASLLDRPLSAALPVSPARCH